ncbi:hypothetical protein TYRP_004577, partial [Tyrophagus putrescentiae]
MLSMSLVTAKHLQLRQLSPPHNGRSSSLSVARRNELKSEQRTSTVLVPTRLPSSCSSLALYPFCKLSNEYGLFHKNSVTSETVIAASFNVHILFPGSRLFCCVCRCCLLNPIENSASCTSCTAVFTLSCPHWRLQCIQSLAGTQQACLRLGSFGFDLVVFFPLSFSSSLSFCSSSSRHSVACLFFGLSVCLCLLIKIQRRHNGSRPMLWCCCRCCCCWLMADAVAAGA